MSSAATSQTTPPRSPRQGKSTFTLWAVVIGLGLLLVSAAYLLLVEAPPPRKIVIATGPERGAYYQFALKYVEELKKDSLDLEVLKTEGSVENIGLLLREGSGVDIAIVQSGVAKPEEREKLHALGSLYREPLWVFYRGEQPCVRLSQLAGRRIGVGSPGSGTYAVAMQLLAANELLDSSGTGGHGQTSLSEAKVADAAVALQRGELDATFMVAGMQADYVKSLLRDDKVRLLSFAQQEAYHRKFRYLSKVSVPMGLVNLGQNTPAQEVSLLAPTAMLVVREGFHPALVAPILNAATRVHGQGDLLASPGEFPSASYTDFPVSEDARHYYKSGPPVLQKLLPFWLASLLDRLKVMLIPLLVLLMPLTRAAPPLARWTRRRKVYLWYGILREIDQKLDAGMTAVEIEREAARLREVEQQLIYMDLPLSYMDAFYHLRVHVQMMLEKLEEARRRIAPQGV